MAEQHLGNGTVLSIIYTPSSTTVASTVAVGNVLSIEGPEPERETVDATLLSSTTPWRTFLVGDGDPGTITATVAYDNVDGSHILGLNVAMNGSTQVQFKLDFNSSMDSETVSGFVVGRGRTIERNGLIQGPVTLKVSSGPGFATTT